MKKKFQTKQKCSRATTLVNHPAGVISLDDITGLKCDQVIKQLVTNS